MYRNSFFKLKLRLLLCFLFFIKSRYLWCYEIFGVFANFGYVYTWIGLVSVLALKMVKVRLSEPDRSSVFTCTEIHFFKLKLRLLFIFYILSNRAIYDVSKFLWFLLIFDMCAHELCNYQYLDWKCSKYDCERKIEVHFPHVQKFFSLN